MVPHRLHDFLRTHTPIYTHNTHKTYTHTFTRTHTPIYTHTTHETHTQTHTHAHMCCRWSLAWRLRPVISFLVQTHVLQVVTHTHAHTHTHTHMHTCAAGGHWPGGCVLQYHFWCCGRRCLRRHHQCDHHRWVLIPLFLPLVKSTENGRIES